jgi:2-oxo-3-(phosphooxy)propyl 3-oxoalkanoate synthase
MTTLNPNGGDAAVIRLSDAPLSYQSTVPRSLVHRSAVSEVFVTDLVPLSAQRFLAAAQLPLTHAYYNDHRQPLPCFDPVLILEAARQAGIAGATLIGLSSDIQMMVGSFTLRLDEPGPLSYPRRPGELRIENSFEAVRVRRGGRVRRGLVRQALALDGQPIGAHVMECQFVSLTEHQALRRVMRQTPAPTTANFPAGPVPDHVPAHEVGRTDQRNVVLAGLSRASGRVSARVAPRFDNRALFDHTYDHLPAMTLTEAARQLALVAVRHETGTMPDPAQIGVITGVFERFAELDSPVYAEATTTWPERDACQVDVTFTQGAEIASTQIQIPVPWKATVSGEEAVRA